MSADELNLVELPAIEQLKSLGWTYLAGEELSPETSAERNSFKDVILEQRLTQSIKRINDWISEENLRKVVRDLTRLHTSSLIEANQKVWETLVEYISVDQDLGKGRKGQTVKIIDFDQDKKRVSLGLKQLTPHPWENVDEQYPEGSNITGKVVSMTNYGAFIEIQPGVEGLVHVSEMSWTRHVKNPSEMYSLGDEVEAVVLSIDPEERKISLGAKQLLDDPWDQIEEKYMIGTVVKGKVINLTQFGAFVELEEGIDGLIHVSDLSWTKVVRHPKEVVEKDQKVEVRVLEVSRESRRIALGLKQLEDDPWPGLVKNFETGKKIEGKVLRVLDKGIILMLENDVEGIIPFGHQTKRQRKTFTAKYKIGQTMGGVVMEVRPDDKKVILFVEELSADQSTQKDNVQEFLESQVAPEGEKIEIPMDAVEKTESKTQPADE